MLARGADLDSRSADEEDEEDEEEKKEIDQPKQEQMLRAQLQPSARGSQGSGRRVTDANSKHLPENASVDLTISAKRHRERGSISPPRISEENKEANDDETP